MNQNPILYNLAQIRSKHYVVKTKFHINSTSKNYFINFYHNKLGSFKQQQGGQFYLIVAGAPDSPEDFYCIPYTILKGVLTEGNLQPKNRWLATIRNHVLIVEKSETRIDVSRFYGADVDGWLTSFIHRALPATASITAPKDKEFYEGSLKRISVEIRERDPAVRKACIEYHECKCWICDFDFGKFYGPEAEGFIHVHHREQLAKAAGRRKVDPIKDLVPLCPNCHSVVHLRKIAYEVDEVKKMVNRQKE
jgi:hypothetical protein